MFVDRVTIRVEGGTGGSGAEAFRREAMNPRGGPSGGDGGDGGDVVLVCDRQLSTLLDFKYRAEYQAERGGHGEGNDRAGRDGEDIELHAPPGTIVRDAETGELLGELLHEGERMVVAAGGRGGRGNARFATPTRQAPTYWEPGESGVARRIELTLKLIADVGLVGQPNAGKSTFLAAVSAARPKVADYPFTTLTPNLGVVELSDFRSFVVADIPGIIQGAHEGRGLGHRFLQHIERTRTLVLLIPCDDPHPQETYVELRDELARYSEELARRPHCIVLTKADLIAPDAVPPRVEGDDPWGVFVISSVTGAGVDALLEALWGQVARRRASPEEAEVTRTERPHARPVGDATTPSTEEAWWNLAEEEA
jgi:GTP-binding protein